METIQLLKDLEQKDEYKKWKKGNKDAFLSYVLRVIENPPNNEWQIGFFNKKNGKITTFTLDNNKVRIDNDEDIFKKEEDIIKRLEIGKIDYSLIKAAKLAEEFQGKNYPSEKPIKIISILQNLPELDNVWNFSFITKSFNTLNIKVSAETGRILKHSLSQIFEFK